MRGMLDSERAYIVIEKNHTTGSVTYGLGDDWDKATAEATYRWKSQWGRKSSRFSIQRVDVFLANLGYSIKPDAPEERDANVE